MICPVCKHDYDVPDWVETIARLGRCVACDLNRYIDAAIAANERRQEDEQQRQADQDAGRQA